MGRQTEAPVSNLARPVVAAPRPAFEASSTNLDFARVAKNDYGIDAVEYVNQFFKDKAKDEKYLAELKKRARRPRRQEPC